MPRYVVRYVKQFGLKDASQVTGTIASVRKSRHYEEEIDEDLVRDVKSARISKGKGTYIVLYNWWLGLILRVYAGRERDEPSFIAEASFVKAPLNSRVGSSNVTPNGKGKARQESLDRVPLEVQEALILEDLLYVLMVRTNSRFIRHLCAPPMYSGARHGLIGGYLGN